MILQVNQRGAWSNVVEFQPPQLRAIQEATVVLAQAVAFYDRSVVKGDTNWRVIARRAKAPKVIAYLDGPDFKWRKR